MAFFGSKINLKTTTTGQSADRTFKKQASQVAQRSSRTDNSLKFLANCFMRVCKIDIGTQNDFLVNKHLVISFNFG